MVSDEHVGWSKVSQKDKELEFARNSLVEELIAVNGYKARIDAADDASLKKLLQHNMDEEKEHVAMIVEWIRKNDRKQDEVFEKHD